jgi:hypothetical protein
MVGLRTKIKTLTNMSSEIHGFTQTQKCTNVCRPVRESKDEAGRQTAPTLRFFSTSPRVVETQEDGFDARTRLKFGRRRRRR